MEKHKIYCFNNGGSPGWYNALAIADDGHCLAGHICSSSYYVSHDLGVTSDWKHDTYNKHFGEGNWEAVFVPDDEVRTHPGLLAAFEKNKALAEQAKGAEPQES